MSLEMEPANPTVVDRKDRRYKDLTPGKKQETLRKLFKAAAVEIDDKSDLLKRLKSLNQDEIFRCIIADPVLTAEIAQSSFNHNHLALALEIDPYAITKETSARFGAYGHHGEQYDLLEALETLAESSTDLDAVLQKWIEHMPMRALLYYWERMSDSQLLACCSICNLNLLFLINVPACYNILARIRKLALNVDPKTGLWLTFDLGLGNKSSKT